MLRKRNDELLSKPPKQAAYRESDGEQPCEGCCFFREAVPGIATQCTYWSAKVEEDYTCDVWCAAEKEDRPMAYAMAEIYVRDSGDQVTLSDEDEGLVWKEIMREGTWTLRPGPGGQAVRRPLHVVRDGKPSKDVLSMGEIIRNFEDGAVQHVTVPTTHENKVLENTGYVRKLKIVGEPGSSKLVAGLEFTEPEVEGKARNGSIPDVSVGVLFDYPNKKTGKVYPQVLQHLALTPTPWLQGMAPFGVAAAEDVEVMAFSDEVELEVRMDNSLVLNPNQVQHLKDQGIDLHSLLAGEASDHTEGGEMSGKKTEESTESTPTTAETPAPIVNLSEHPEYQAMQAEIASLRRDRRERDVKEKIRGWQGKGLPPAILTKAEKIMLADEGAEIMSLNLSEDGAGEAKSLTASSIVEELLMSIPAVEVNVHPLLRRMANEQEADTTPELHTLRERGMSLSDDQGEIEKRADFAREYLGLSKSKLASGASGQK